MIIFHEKNLNDKKIMHLTNFILTRTFFLIASYQILENNVILLNHGSFLQEKDSLQLELFILENWKGLSCSSSTKIRSLEKIDNFAFKNSNIRRRNFLYQFLTTVFFNLGKNVSLWEFLLVKILYFIIMIWNFSIVHSKFYYNLY